MLTAITSGMWDIAVNATGLCAILCLAVPAWHANKYGRLAGRLVRSRTAYQSPTVQQSRRNALASLRHLQNEWTVWKSNLLIIGTVLAGLSYLLGLLKIAVAH
jgi:hypothetical protein